MLKISELIDNSKVIDTHTIAFGDKELTVDIREVNNAKKHLGMFFKERFFLTVNGNLNNFSIKAVEATEHLTFILKQKQDLRNNYIERIAKKSNIYNYSLKLLTEGKKGFVISATNDLKEVKTFLSETYSIELN